MQETKIPEQYQYYLSKKNWCAESEHEDLRIRPLDENYKKVHLSFWKKGYNKIYEKLYVFYISKIRFRKTRIKAIIKNDIHFKNDKKIVDDANLPNSLSSEEKINEIIYTMQLIRENVDHFFRVEKNEEKVQIFNEFLESLHIPNK